MGIISQPDWRSADAFKALGKPNLLFGIATGSVNSMINHYTADRKRRNDDAYTAGDVAGKRPDRETDEKTSAVHFMRFELSSDQLAALKDGAKLFASVERAHTQSHVLK